jgi:cobalt-zinc-cadmium efflux system outer membrane protein
VKFVCSRKFMKPIKILYVLAAGMLALAGCRGVPTSGEKQARRDLGAVAGQYRPGTQRPALHELTPDLSLSNYLAFALLNSPAVEAAFYDWSASVENITVTRSQPDPQLTFQAYVQDVITSLMPGFAWNFPGPGKLKARAGVATAESQGKYFAFESAVLQAAFNLKRAYYQLDLLDEQLRLKRETLSLLENQERAVRAQDTAGAASLPDVLRVQGERDHVRAELANLEDSRRSRLENFKAALGLTPEQPNPPTPAHFEMSSENPDADELLRVAFERNPQLKAMAAEVRAAEAGIAVAYKERVPDFSVALMADIKASPVLYWPQASMSLPIWRDKIAAQIAEAQAAVQTARSVEAPVPPRSAAGSRPRRVPAREPWPHETRTIRARQAHAANRERPPPRCGLPGARACVLSPVTRPPPPCRRRRVPWPASASSRCMQRRATRQDEFPPT